MMTHGSDFELAAARKGNIWLVGLANVETSQQSEIKLLGGSSRRGKSRLMIRVAVEAIRTQGNQLLNLIRECYVDNGQDQFVNLAAQPTVGQVAVMLPV